MKKRILAALLVGAMTIGTAGCATLDRMGKSLGSDLSGGLNRTVTVYSLDGNTKIAEYKGKLDVETTENKVFFDLNGKRTIIYNATVIVQED